MKNEKTKNGSEAVRCQKKNESKEILLILSSCSLSLCSPSRPRQFYSLTGASEPVAGRTVTSAPAEHCLQAPRGRIAGEKRAQEIRGIDGQQSEKAAGAKEGEEAKRSVVVAVSL